MRSLFASARRSRVLLASAALAVAAPILWVGAAADAQGGPSAQTFSECPVHGYAAPNAGKVTVCVVGVANQGTIAIGNLNVTFAGPGVIQGGVNLNRSQKKPNWSQALNGQSFITNPQLLPKPAMALLGNPPDVTPPPDPDVYVQAIQAGPITFGLSAGLAVTTTIPLEFQVINSLVGPNCYIGTDSDPVVLTLTTGASGALTGTLGNVETFHQGKVLQTEGTEVVDGTFSVPGATGCGNGGVFDDDIDTTNALPSASGLNQVELYGTFDLAESAWVAHALGE